MKLNEKRYRFWVKVEDVEYEYFISLSTEYDNDDVQGYLENWVFSIINLNDSRCVYGFEVIPDKIDKYAVLMGRFQPFHREHYKLIYKIANKYKNIIILIGEKKNDDQLEYFERATIINDSVKDLFDNIAIMPMYDFPGDDASWAADVIERCFEVIEEVSNLVIIKPRKSSDILPNGYHYLDIFNNVCQVDDIEVGNHEIHASNIRANPQDNLDLVYPMFRRLVENDIGKPYPKEYVRATRAGKDDDWVILKTFNREERVPYVYAHRKNKDSVAFIFYNTRTYKYGIIIEQKPPIGSMKTFSAFGGSFDNPTDNPYRILRQEALEEAGIKDIIPCYKGSYMATTQSDEIMHLYVLETEEEIFNPQTEDVGEIGNICVWLTREEIESIPDWRVQLCLRK